MKCWCRSWVDSTPTTAMLSVFENCASSAARLALLPQLRRPAAASKTPASATRAARSAPRRSSRAPRGRRTTARPARGTAASCARRISAGTRPAADALEHVLLVEHAQLVVGRQRFGQRDDVGDRGTESGPRPSAPSACGRPATRAGSRRAACESRGTGPARAATSARSSAAASASSSSRASRPASASRSAGAEQPLQRAGRLPARVVAEAGRAPRRRGCWPKNCRAIACCATGERARYG